MWRASALVMHQRDRGWLAEYAASLHACQPTKTECLDATPDLKWNRFCWACVG